ncbi:hypothetical protein BMS3Abin10_00996 [bacterium BMS3Abin10]|nr:hypothetical protein BMS3Abin10_00996 [bacterium BMS3Abin10]GBE39224.1 hypothetical protein BMS3Bbin08_01846 [bacterium BMS3Bbin08]
MKKTIAVLFMLIFLVLGCAKEKVKPSADSLMTQNVLGVLESIKHAYEKKDGIVIEKRLAPALSKDILDGFTFETAELTFNPRMVKINADSDVTVKLIWRGTWVVGGESLKGRGIGTLTFNGKTLELMKIEGNDPFRTPKVE